MEKFVSLIRPRRLESKHEVPRDGTYRYLYDIWQPLAILLPTFLFTMIFYTTYKADEWTNPNAFFICNDNGYVEKTRYGHNPLWDPRLYFTINMAFGKFAFSTVKVIDAAWDAVIGRGGQVVAALIAYRTLRRSLTLTMESCALAIPTVTSLYCQQIQAFPVMQMAYDFFWNWGDFNSPVWRKPNLLGRLRLATQIFTCVYVLLFATLVSIMTGYRAQLTGLVGDNAQSVPISDLVIPRLILRDGNRIGLPNSQVLAVDEVPYPSNAIKTPRHEAVFAADEFIKSSRNFEEPYGTLVDYYFTCMAVKKHFQSSDKTYPSYQLSCGVHNCSCSVPTYGLSGGINTSAMNMTSSIILNNSSWDIMPPLALEIFQNDATWWWGVNGELKDPNIGKNLSNAIDYWSGSTLAVFNARLQAKSAKAYMHGDSLFNTTTILNEGRCIVDDAYSWGFSSLLLLTFCCFTMVFALGLIFLQTDVYWHSRHDRNHQSYSIYTDVIFLAEELRAASGDDLKEHLRSPKSFQKQIEHTKKGVRLEVSTLPLSRWEEANSYRSVFRPYGRIRRLIRREHRLVSTSHSEMAQSQEEDTELEMVEQASAASSALSLQPEAVDTIAQDPDMGDGAP